MNKEKFLAKNQHMYKWDSEYRDTFFDKMDAILPVPEALSDAQTQTLKSMQQTLLQTDNMLSILRELGFDYTLGIAGGAVRDLVLDKTEHMGDFDIVISFPCLQDPTKIKNKTSISQTYSIIPWNTRESDPLRFKELIASCLDEVQKINNAPNLEKLSKIVNLLISRTHKTTLYLNNEGKVSDYQNNQMHGLIKFEGASKPVDLIISENEAGMFMHSFSFDLCKAFIPFYSVDRKTAFRDNPVIIKDMPELEHADGYLQVLDNVFMAKYMIHDIERKSMTVNCAQPNFKLEHLKYFLNKHYLKMSEKFPDYSLNFRGLAEPFGNMEKDAMHNYIKEFMVQVLDRMPKKEEKTDKKMKI